MNVQRVVRLVVVFVFVLLPAAAFAQSSITGVVRDASGGVLPGVTVEASSPALIEGSKSAVTDASGLFRVVDLRPGPYTVTFSLQGFTTSKRDGIVLTDPFDRSVGLDIGRPTAPIVDIRSSGAQMQVQRDTLEALPGTGRLALLNTLIPGASLTASTERSAGGNDRTQTRFSVHGAPEAQPYVDGINQQIPGITIGVFVFSQLNIQEVTATSGGDAARQRAVPAQRQSVARPAPEDPQPARSPVAGGEGQDVRLEVARNPRLLEPRDDRSAVRQRLLRRGLARLRLDQCK